MATTDTRSGFRLPWSSDRSHAAPAADEASAPEPAAEPAPTTPEWPSTDFNALGTSSQPRAIDPDAAAPDVDADGEAAPSTAGPEANRPASATPPVTPRKPSKLMADLSAAIRATAETAREQALTQVDADVAAVVGQIRAVAKDGEHALRAQCDADLAAIKEWSRAEIARIKEAAEQRIAGRKQGLDGQLAGHAAAIEDRVHRVQETAAAYRAEMAAYAERLGAEDDPARLATMAERLPDAPALEALAGIADLHLDLQDAPLEEPEVAEPFASAEAVVEAEAVATPEVEAVEPQVEAVAEPVVETEPEMIVEPATAVPDPPTAWGAASPWRDSDHAWGAAPAPESGDAQPESGDAQPESDWSLAESAAADPAWAEAEAEADADPRMPTLEDDGSGEWTATGGVPRWAPGEVPEGFPTGDGDVGDPVDRGAIMAALEAAAEAVVAAESAAESADQAEAAADVAETAAELLKGRVDADEEYDPEAAAALSARVGAGGFEESYTDRLASLLPGHADGPADGEPRTTQVIVSGLVSVASIASFKRHLGRLAGVQSVAVASGPEGEFVFNVSHRPDVSFRDAVPTMPGFAARVTGTADGVVHVSARDPESEG